MIKNYIINFINKTLCGIGNSNPSLERLQQIADELGVPVAELFGEHSLTCPKCGAKLKLVEDSN